MTLQTARDPQPPLQGARDFLGVGFWGELHGLADAHLNLSGRGIFFPGVLDRKSVV